MLCVKCRKWTLARCTKWKRVTSVSAEGFVYKRCKMMTINEISVERLNDDAETVEGFCYLGNAFNASGGSEMTVVVRTRIGWMRFRECEEVLYGRFCTRCKGKCIRFV